MGSQGVRHDWATEHSTVYIKKYIDLRSWNLDIMLFYTLCSLLRDLQMTTLLLLQFKFIYFMLLLWQISPLKSLIEMVKADSIGLVQDNRVEYALTSPCKSTQITNSCWIGTTPTKKIYPMSKRQRKGCNKMVGGTQSYYQIQCTPSGWPTKLESNNTKEVLLLLWRCWALCEASQPGDLTKGLGIHRESEVEDQWDEIARFSQDWEKQRFHSWRLHSWRAHTKSVHTRTQGKGRDPTGDWARLPS